MNKEIKKLWVKALKSDKYKQGKYRLRYGKTRPKFCCLGVLCDIYVKEDPKNRKWTFAKRGEMKYAGTIHKQELGLPKEVIKWAGLTEPAPMIPYNSGYSCLSQINDSGLSFKNIGNLINKHL